VEVHAFFLSRMIAGGDVMESTSQVSFNLSCQFRKPGPAVRMLITGEIKGTAALGAECR
jgi:hypothetical protein